VRVARACEVALWPSREGPKVSLEAGAPRRRQHARGSRRSGAKRRTVDEAGEAWGCAVRSGGTQRGSCEGRAKHGDVSTAAKEQ